MCIPKTQFGISFPPGAGGHFLISLKCPDLIYKNSNHNRYHHTDPAFFPFNKYEQHKKIKDFVESIQTDSALKYFPNFENKNSIGFFHRFPYHLLMSNKIHFFDNQFFCVKVSDQEFTFVANIYAIKFLTSTRFTFTKFLDRIKKVFGTINNIEDDAKNLKEFELEIFGYESEYMYSATSLFFMDCIHKNLPVDKSNFINYIQNKLDDISTSLSVYQYTQHLDEYTNKIKNTTGIDVIVLPYDKIYFDYQIDPRFVPISNEIKDKIYQYSLENIKCIENLSTKFKFDQSVISFVKQKQKQF